jgi:tetratricopeptide (TPR) repeat protein
MNPQTNLKSQEAHAAFYASYMEQHWQELKGSRQLHALSEIEADIQNVRTAWRYCLHQKQVPQIRKFIHGLWYIYWVRSWNHAGMAQFAKAVRALQTKSSKEARALKALAMAYQSYFMSWLGLSKHGFKQAGESVAILEKLDRPEMLVFAYYSQGISAYMLNRYEEMFESTNKLYKIAIEIGDKWLSAFLSFELAMVALITEDYAEAKRIAEANLALCDEIGDVIGSTMPLIILGHVAFAEGELQQARKHYLHCLRISQQVGFNYSIQTSSKYLGKVVLSLGNITEAESYLVQCLKLTKEVGFIRDVINLLSEFARLKTAQGHFEQAVELLGLVLQHPASQQNRWLEGTIEESAQEMLVEISAQLPAENYRDALERGRKLELDQLIDNLVGQ